MDFVSDALAGRRRIKALTIMDDFANESVDIAVDHGISGTMTPECWIRRCVFGGAGGDQNQPGP